MQTPFDLRQLRTLRRNGQSPSLPVFLTNNWQFQSNLQQCGAMVIRVNPGDSSEDWEAIAGLEVILALPDLRPWTPLMQAVRDSRPRRLQVIADDGLTTIWRGA